MTDIYIHIGTHKTGTTTIQHALQDAANFDKNLIYKGTNSTAKGLMRAENYDKNIVQQLNDIIQNMIHDRQSASKVVFSAEALSGLASNGYQNSNVVYTMLRDATYQYNVKIIVYLRRQDSFVESMYTQKIHEGETLDFESFLMQYDSPDALDYRRILEDLSSCFGNQNLIVRSYHEASERGLLIDFGEIIQIKSLQYSKKGDKNPSYSRQALEIAKICNTYLDQNSKRQLRQALQSTLAKKRFEPFSYFTDEQRAKFLNKYEISNFDVAYRYFSGDLERLFPAPKPSKPVSQNESLTNDEVAGLVVQILNGNTSKTEASKPESGIIAGIRVAISGYPRLRSLLRKVRKRL